MTKEEADMLIAHYQKGLPEELAILKQSLTPSALRYVEALELALAYAETDAITATEEEEERYREIARKHTAWIRGEN